MRSDLDSPADFLKLYLYRSAIIGVAHTQTLDERFVFRMNNIRPAYKFMKS